MQFPRFPLGISDIGLWLAIMAIILLTASELVSSSTGTLGNVAIEKNRLRFIAIAVGICFMVVVAMRIAGFE